MLLVLIIAGVFGAVTCLAAGLLRRAPVSAMETRINDFRTRSAFTEDGDVDLEAAFMDRILRPAVEGMARAVSSLLPASLLADIQQQLTTAGNPMRLNTYVTFWAISMGVFGLIGVMVCAALPSSLFMQKLLIGGVFLLLGWMFPRAWLKAKVKAKQKAVLKALPDALDLITTCVEAGLGLDAALARVAEKSIGPLADEIANTLRDIAMGKLRREALTDLSQRVNVEELTHFVNSVIQAEQLGVGIAQVLRVQSEQLRTRRRQRAERSAHEAPIKMLFPLVLFIFPAFLLVILGPAMIRMAGGF